MRLEMKFYRIILFFSPVIISVFAFIPYLYPTASQQMKYYRIDNKQMPWGDYGNSLLRGSLSKENGTLRLSRTGPYIPPIIDVHLNDWIVTDEFKQKLEASQLKGFSFQKVELLKIVRINWKEWDLDAQEPLFYPDSGEPEDYVNKGVNDAELYANSTDFWRLITIESVELEMRQGDEWWKRIPVIISNSWPNSNFAISNQIHFTFIDQTAMKWLAANSDGNLEFKEIESK